MDGPICEFNFPIRFQAPEKPFVLCAVVEEPSKATKHCIHVT